MKNNEQLALQQIINFAQHKEYEKLGFYLQIIDSKHFLNKNYAKIFEALKYFILEKRFNATQITSELLNYLQTNYPKDNFTNDSIAFLHEVNVEVNGFNFLDNLKYTYNQEEIFKQLIKTIRPTHEPETEHERNQLYKTIFQKIRKIMSLIPNENDKKIFHVSEMIKQHPEIFSASDDAKQQILNQCFRLSNNFYGLNVATKGFKEGQVITIGGTTGLGKTAFVYNLLLDITKQRFEETTEHPHIMVFSLGMSMTENLSPLISHQAQISLDIIRDKSFYTITKDEYIEKMNEVQEFLQQTNLTFNYSKEVNLEYIMDLIYRLHLEQKVKIVVIDYLQIIKTANNTDDERKAIDEIMFKLKQIAVDLKIVVIVLSQYSRAHNTHGNSPAITALKGSSGIEQNSDIVLLMSEFKPKINSNQLKRVGLYADGACQELYFSVINEEGEKYEHINGETIVELAIKKNCSGTKDKTLLYHFTKKTQTFKEVGCVAHYNYEKY